MTLSSTSPLLLAQGGNPLMKIVLPAGASAPEEFAAEDLRRHLHQLAGATPMMRISFPADAPTIFVNDQAAAEAAGIDVAGLALGAEAFHQETRGGNLYLLGGGPRGVLYGVYDLLESLGCRWFAPEVSVIPQRRRVELPALCKTGAPAFEFRDTYNWEACDPLWWVHNRLNGQFTPVPGYLGGQVSYGLFVHTFYVLVPPGEFFATHPEYFSLLNGKRTWERGQLCLTNPEVLRIVTERVLSKCANNRRRRSFPSRRTIGRAIVSARAAGWWPRRKARRPARSFASSMRSRRKPRRFSPIN